MTAPGVIVIFAFSWWLIFFLLLPLKIRQSESLEPGHAAGAPDKPLLFPKALGATGIAIIITLFAYWVIAKSGWSLEDWLGVTNWEEQIEAMP